MEDKSILNYYRDGDKYFGVLKIELETKKCDNIQELTTLAREILKEARKSIETKMGRIEIHDNYKKRMI